MAENVQFIGVGLPAQAGKPEKPTLKDWAKKTFTFQGNEAAWRQKHQKDLELMRTINEALPPEKRGEVMEKIEKHIKSSAKLRVVGNYTALTAITAAVVGETLLIANPRWAQAVENKKILGKRMLKPFGWSARMARSGLESVFRKKDNRIGLREYLSTLHIPTLEGLNRQIPVKDVIDLAADPNPKHNLEFIPKKEGLDVGFDSAKQLLQLMMQASEHYGRWVPLVLENDNLMGFHLFEDLSAIEGMHKFIENGLMDQSPVGKNRIAYFPTAKLLNSLKKSKI